MEHRYRQLMRKVRLYLLTEVRKKIVGQQIPFRQGF